MANFKISLLGVALHIAVWLLPRGWKITLTAQAPDMRSISRTWGVMPTKGNDMDDLVKRLREYGDFPQDVSMGEWAEWSHTAADRIAALKQERDEAVAAALEGLCESGPSLGASTPEPGIRALLTGYYGCHFSPHYTEMCVEKYIRALTPADATAALAARDRQMIAEGMRRAAEQVRRLFSEGSSVPPEAVKFIRATHDAILTAASEMEKGDGMGG